MNFQAVNTDRLVLNHVGAVFAYMLLATVFLYDVLFFDQSLSGFDIILAQDNWREEFDFQGTPQRVLADSPMAHYPQRKFYADLLREGHGANFNPYIFNGIPVRSEGVGEFLTSLPQLWLDTPNAIDWSAWLRLILAGSLMYLLLHRLGAGLLPAFLGGVVWTYNLHQIVWLEFPQHLATQLWIPLLFMLSLDVLRHGMSRQRLLWLILTTILFYTSGYTQIVVYTFVFIGVFSIASLLIERGETFGIRIKRWLSLYLGYIAAFIILAPLLWYDINELQNGLRGTQSFRLSAAVATPSWSWLLDSWINLLPDLGDLKRLYSPSYLGGIWGLPYDNSLYGNIVEGGAYIGILTLFLVPLSLLTRTHPSLRKITIVLVLLMLFFLGLNHRDPLLLWIASRVPFLGFGSYGRSLTIITFIASILTAIGLAAFLQLLKYRLFKIPVVVFILVLCLPLLANTIWPELALRRFVYPLVLIGVSSVLVAISFRFNKTAWAGGIILFIVIVDLFAVSIRFNTRLDNDLIFPVNEMIERLQSDPEPYRVVVLSKQHLYRPNILSYYQIPTVGGYSNLTPASYLKSIKRLFPDASLSLNGILSFEDTDIDLMRLLNVKYIISDRPFEHEDLILEHQNSEEYLYRIDAFLPRAYCIQDADMESLNKVGFDATSLNTTTCNINNLQVFTNGLAFNVENTGQTQVIAPYNDTGHWRLLINGEKYPWAKNPPLFISFMAPAGRHHIEIKQHNPLLIAAAIAVILFGVGVIVISLISRQITPASLVLIGVILILIAKSLCDLPSIRQDAIPERNINLAFAPTDKSQ